MQQANAPQPPAARLSMQVTLLLLLLWAVSAALRLQAHDPGLNLINLDAPQHALLTVKAWLETPAATHRFVPMVSLSEPMDRFIPWGRSVADAAGNQYYLSFPPLGFFAPYLFFLATGLSVGLLPLLGFNLALHGISAFLMARLAARWLAVSTLPQRWHGTGAVLVAASYLFAVEALYAHGPIYWHHSLFQPFWLLQLTLLFDWAQGQRSGWRLAALATLSFLLPSIEWSGYLASLAGALVLWRCASPQAPRRVRFRPAFLLVGMAMLAGIALLWHYAALFGIDTLAATFTDRVDARGLHAGSVAGWFSGLFDSFGVLPLIGLVAGWILFHRDGISRTHALLLIAASLPLLENLVMLQHAVEYRFDRLKILVPLLLLLSLALPRLEGRRRILFVFVWALAIASNIALYLAHPRSWDISEVVAHNTRVRERIAVYDTPCTLYASEGMVRARMNLWLGKSLYELTSLEGLTALVKNRGACQGIWLGGTQVLPGAFRIDTVMRVDPANGGATRIYP